MITISEWFELIEKCEILPWICACINKKYILKEHVKLMMSTNPLQLRKNYEEAKKQASTNFEWMNLFIRIGCTNQIIENHKLRRLDFSSAYRVFTYTKNPEETFYKLGSREIAWLKRYTDEMYLKDKMKCKQS
ncbi:MAG TPA: hypothetical protein DDW20_00710 [Firmicutes bacterium]|nr:hypothetical protein [Bacillota bacterium]